jgi:hypothetical protein
LIVLILGVFLMTARCEDEDLSEIDAALAEEDTEFNADGMTSEETEAMKSS